MTFAVFWDSIFGRRFDSEQHERQLRLWLRSSLEQFIDSELDCDLDRDAATLAKDDGIAELVFTRDEAYLPTLYREEASKSSVGTAILSRLSTNYFGELEEKLGSACDAWVTKTMLECWRMRYRRLHGLDVFHYMKSEELISIYDDVRGELIRERYNSLYGKPLSIFETVEHLTFLYVEHREKGAAFDRYTWSKFVYSYFGKFNRALLSYHLHKAYSLGQEYYKCQHDVHQKLMWNAVPDIFLITMLYQLEHGVMELDFEAFAEIGRAYGVFEGSSLAEGLAEHGITLGSDGLPPRIVIQENGTGDDASESADEPSAESETPSVVSPEGWSEDPWAGEPWEARTLLGQIDGGVKLFFPGDKLGPLLASRKFGEFELRLHDNLGDDRVMGSAAGELAMSLMGLSDLPDAVKAAMRNVPYRSGIFVIERAGKWPSFAGYWMNAWDDSMAVDEDVYDEAPRDVQARYALDQCLSGTSYGEMWDELGRGPDAMPILYATN